MKKEILNHGLIFGDRISAAKLYIFDLRGLLLSVDPAVLQQGARQLWAQLEDTEVEVLYVKGIGGLPWAIYIRNAAAEKGRILQILFVRDERKNRNRKKRVEGLDPELVRVGAPAVFVDDLANSGKTQKEALAALHADGYKLKHLGIAVVVDLWNQSRTQEAMGYKVARLFRRHELGLTRVDPPLGLLKNKPVWRHFRHHREDVMVYRAPPTIHFDRLYAPSDANELHCIDPDTGDVFWTIVSSNPQPKGSCCRVQSDGTHIYWTSYDGTLAKVDPYTGDQVWCVYLDQAVHSTPCLLGDGRLVVATERDKEIIGNFWYGQGDFVCIDTQNGKTLWRVPTQGMVPGSPTFHKGLGLAIVGSNDFFLYAVAVDSGQLRHQLPTKGEVKGTPALWKDTVITLSIKGWCQSFDLITGELRWEKHIGYEAMHPEPLVIDDKVYMVAKGDDGIVFCLDCDSGEIQWLTRVRGNAGWGVTRRGNQLLATGHNGYVVTLNKDTGEKILYSRMDMFNPGLAKANVFTPPVLWKNRVIWITNDKGIVCFEFGDQQ